MLVFLPVLFVFMLTVSPVVYVGDTGEIVTAAYSLGIAHPPGYPSYTTLGHVFTYLPLSNIAFRVNLLAAFLAALAALFFCKFLVKISSLLELKEEYTVYLSAGTALLFAFSRTFWAQGVMAKGGIYQLNLIFMLWGGILFLEVIKNRDKRSFLWLSLVCGLALTNHHSFLGAAALMYLLVLLYERKFFFKHLFAGVLILGAGLLYYLYLPVRASFHPSLNWGDPDSINKMLDVILRSQYGKLGKGDRGIMLYLTQCYEFAKILVQQFTWVIFPCVLAGAVLLFRKNRKVFLFPALLFCVYFFYMIYTTNPKLTTNDIEVVEPFIIPAYMAAAAFVFYFLYSALEKFGKKILMVPVCLLFVLPLVSNYRYNNRSNNYIAANYGVNMLRTPEKDALLFASQDNEVFILAYYKKVERARPDVTVYEDLGCVFDNIYGEDMMKVSMAEHERKRRTVQMKIVETTSRPVYYLRTSSMYKWMQGKPEVKQTGLMFKLGTPPGKDYFSLYNLSQLDDMSIWKEYLMRDTVAQYYYSMGETALVAGDKTKAFQYFEKARAEGDDISWVNNNIGILMDNMGLLDEAMENYNKAIAANPKSPIAHYNLGLIYKKKKKLAEAEAEYLEALRLNPVYSDALNNLGSLYANNGRPLDAKAVLLRGIAVSPDNPDLFYNLGVSLNDLGEYNEALKAFDAALRLNPYHAEAYNGKAFSYFSTGNLDKAIEMCTLALKIKPAYRDAATNLERLKQMRGR